MWSGYREQRPTAQVVCISILTTIHKTIHAQPGSIAGAHRKASEHRIGDCDLISKGSKQEINLDGSKCWMSHFVCRQFNFPSFHLLWSDDRRSLPLLYHPSGIGHPFPLLSSWFSGAAIRTLLALSFSARREVQWSKPRQAQGEERRRRGERTSGGTGKEGGGGRTKGKDEGCSLVLLCPTFSGGFQSRRGWREGEAEAGVRQIKNGRKEKRDSKEDGIQWRAEWSQLCWMRCWWDDFPDQFYPVRGKSRSCFPEPHCLQKLNSDSKRRTCVCMCVLCVRTRAFVGDHRWFMQSKTQPLLASDHKGPRTLQSDDKL